MTSGDDQPTPPCPTFRPGERVRLPRHVTELELSTESGTIVQELPEQEGYYLVRLDSPARWHPLGLGNTAESQLLDEIRVPSFNLRPLSSRVATPHRRRAATTVRQSSSA